MYKYILVVDDDINLAYAIQSYISSSERKVFIVDNSAAAIKLLGLYNFQLVISDIMMPNHNGYELLSYLRLDSNLSSIPFIFLTAKGLTVDRVKGYNLGCNVYLTKPFHPSELLSIVNNLLYLFKDPSQILIKNERKDVIIQNVDLTSREYSILNLLVKGHTNREMAYLCHMSVRNVEKYVSRLLSKTGTRNRTELAQLVLANSLKANDGTRTRE
uniref:Uncharacterized protein n=1 Tax=Porolithon onkodes TaxID=231751 RepID=A0A2Z2KS24_9FLOR|nr:hypothetical protein [Porolithon onkodes]ASB29668.1 hypothetical protein [Porolithon onkodes]